MLSAFAKNERLMVSERIKQNKKRRSNESKSNLFVMMFTYTYDLIKLKLFY